jgi:hypothetical protein
MSQPAPGLSAKLGLTAAATGAVYLLPGAGQAAIVTMDDVGGAPFSGTSASLETTPIPWDIDNNGTMDVQFWGLSSPGFLGVAEGSDGGWFHATADGFTAIRNLPLGLSVGAAPGYASGYGTHVLQAYGAFNDLVGFSNGVTGYSGFAFDIAGANHYGWVEWTHTLATGPGTGLVEVSNWAFEDAADTPIQVGDLGAPSAVPVPTSLALLASGAGGLLAWRRRRSPRRDARAAAA